MGPPITYRLDGRQYVALMGGVGATGGDAGPGNQATPFSPKLMTFVLDGRPVTAPPEVVRHGDGAPKSSCTCARQVLAAADGD